MIEDAEFRRVLGHLATGVTIVTTRRADGSPCGLTANAVCSVSLEPPLVLVCVEHSADTHACIREAGCFAVNVLDGSQERLARRFAGADTETKFDGIAHRTASTGAPVLDDALAWTDCNVHAEYDGGDHTIFLGTVIAGDARDGIPLVYYRGGYGRFGP